MNAAPPEQASFHFIAHGHPNVSGTHRTTFEITAEPDLTPTGHCIIAIGAPCGAAGLPDNFRALLADDLAILLTTLRAGGETVSIRSRGHAAMTLDHPTDMVWRRSTFVCSRTIGIASDTTAAMLPKPFIKALQGGADCEVEMVVFYED